MDWEMTEKGHCRRAPVRAQIEGHDNDVFVVDLCPKGVRLIGDFKPRSDLLELRIELNGVIYRCRGYVAWMCPVGDTGRYHLGIRFEDLARLEGSDQGHQREVSPTAPEGTLRDLSDDELYRLETLASISRLLNDSTDVDDVMAKVVKSLVHHLQTERALLLVPSAHGYRVAQVAGKQETAFSSSVIEKVEKADGAILSLDASNDPKLSESESLKLFGTRSILCVPIASQGRWLGLIYLDSNTATKAFAEPELHLVSIVAGMAASAIERVGFFEILRESERALAAAHHELNSLVELNPDGILVLDKECEVVYSNPAATRYLDGNVAAVRALLSTDSHRPELAIKRHENSVGIAQACVEKTRWADHEATLITLRDVTGLREKEAQLRHSQKMQAIGKLAGGVAHDFNNLLTAILGSCELIQTSSQEDEAELQSIKDCAKRAAGLTQQLLTFSRKRVHRPSQIFLERSLESLRKMLSRVLGEDVKLVISETTESLPILADEDEVGQIIVNLAINAREAIDHGGVIEIALRSELKDGASYAVLEVRDDGRGMDEETRERVFEPFFTTKAQGTGLGLSTVYGIVEACSGHISVKSLPGQGSSFSVYFPLARPELQHGEESPRRGITGGSGQIILVEDEHSVRHLVTRVLQRAGYKVTSFETAEEALNLDLEPFDLLLSDIMLPGMNGLDLAKILVERKPDLKVVLMSGYSEGILDSRGSSPERFPFIPKPFDVAELTLRLKSILSETGDD